MQVSQQLYHSCGNQAQPIKMLAVLTHCDAIKPSVVQNPAGLPKSVKINDVVKSFAAKSGMPPLQARAFPAVCGTCLRLMSNATGLLHIRGRLYVAALCSALGKLALIEYARHHDFCYSSTCAGAPGPQK